MVPRKEEQWFVSLVPLIGLDINVSVCQSNYNRDSDVCMDVSHVLDRQLLERLMSPKSQVKLASAF